MSGFQSIAAVAVSTTEIWVSWQLGGLCSQAATNISIMYSDASQIVTHVDPSASGYRMAGLRPSTAYLVIVWAWNELGAVNESVLAVTLEPCQCANTGIYVHSWHVCMYLDVCLHV